MKKKSTILIIFGNFIAGIFAIVLYKYGGDLIYSTLRDTGLTPDIPYSDQRYGKHSKVDVYFMPFDGFSESIANQIANRLSKDLNINIKIFLALPLDSVEYNDYRNQYVAESLGNPIASAINTMHKRDNKTAYIGLLNDDMYPSDERFNYLFSIHFEGNISVIATNRLIPIGLIDKEKAQKLYGERLLKIVKRTIGQQFLGKKRSSKRSSLMYSPLLGPDDIDKMSFEF
jgi:hypothetical protein